jgi:hypothetical protein
MLDPRPGAPVVSNPPTSDVQQRWQADRVAAAAGDPWAQSPEKVSMVKLPDGTVVARARTGADGAPADSAKPGDQQHQQQPQPQPLNADGKIQLTPDIALSESELRDLLAHKSAEDSRKLTAPAKVEDFKLELPADLKMPEGVDFRIDPNNPAIEPARAFALRNNLSQQQFSEMLGLYAATQASEAVAFNNAKAAEVAKLGDAGAARVDSVLGWLKSMSGNHFNALARVLQIAPVADTVVGLEHLMHRYVTQGGASFDGAHREPHIPGRVSQETYDSYSYSQKLDYAAKFPQQPGGR